MREKKFGSKNSLSKKVFVKENLTNKNFGPKLKFGSKKFGKNQVRNSRDIPVWTNVSRTNVAWINVAWTNVTVTVGICCIWFQKPTIKVWSKSGK